jgi:hypothetical protein
MYYFGPKQVVICTNIVGVSVSTGGQGVGGVLQQQPKGNGGV